MLKEWVLIMLAGLAPYGPVGPHFATQEECATMGRHLVNTPMYANAGLHLYACVKESEKDAWLRDRRLEASRSRS